ncbi:MAG: alpha-L-rhamnosidase N-terminal domain-containing protein, partial [Clostridiales bacterium]|nr:alpha-L-rhamnosidase N-terminal domain-containing protein [Clostridiales bacterium]
MVNPLGLQTANPTLSWNCADGITQTAYQIIAKSKNRIVWDSGKVASSQMSVEYGGSAAGARERIDWSVTLWDENGEPGQPESAWFEMGLMDGSWEAKWIDPELPHEEKTRQPASVLRKTFFTDTTENARLYITCHGMYKARINGKPAHSFVYAPGTDDYRKRLQYQVYDVTELLKSGENEIAVTLGDGWYRGNNG